ncbi:phosphoenolpyruvate--protein phosphotransferase [Amycolatopsis sp. K13G38]|uniref:Phosphoenolpyruvate-protein phosphotransferase n=1 Tax=Amycolatopsis acididurans TaxID=2724524 RepID=A0ABX1JEB0_9PSEU|nr:phosphoenolpyruvate--protein phosphotransferase [Amycolatopsis acididurans]NKQ57784.1 phosphoenolpyruvate--protein phosphotransferase [Amycolatopsis acididurans]
MSTAVDDSVVTGIGVSPGVAAGPVARLAEPPALPADTGPEPDADAAAGRAREALAAVAADLESRAARATGEAADVLLAQAMMVRDPALTEQVSAALAGGKSLPHAVAAAFDVFRSAMEAAGGYLAERTADLADLCRRTLACLLGLPMPGIPDPGHPFVLVATDLAPADTATLDPSRVLAIVTGQGGPTSHTAILAKSLGIPAVVACHRAGGITDDTELLVDGTTGTVVVTPPAEEVERALSAWAAHRDALSAARGPGRTQDGTSVALLVNLGGAADLSAAAAADSEGVGLLRTEFLYLGRTEAPARDEQCAAYGKVFAAFSGRKVVVRTLDAGADKPLPYLGQGEEPNPALGVRGLRLDRRQPRILDEQLAAIATARDQHDAEVWVMAPMVSTPAEAAAFAARARSHGLGVAGTMIEVPAAALRAQQVLAGCDFASIGTNDLGQYTYAADRMAGELADLLDPWQPALLELVRHAAEAGRRAGKPVGVCGEAAGDPYLALVLAGVGVTSLSMAPASLAAVRLALAAHTLAECQALAEMALSAEDARHAREAITAGANPITTSEALPAR